MKSAALSTRDVACRRSESMVPIRRLQIFPEKALVDFPREKRFCSRAKAVIMAASHCEAHDGRFRGAAPHGIDLPLPRRNRRARAFFAARHGARLVARGGGSQ